MPPLVPPPPTVRACECLCGGGGGVVGVVISGRRHAVSEIKNGMLQANHLSPRLPPRLASPPPEGTVDDGGCAWSRVRSLHCVSDGSVEDRYCLPSCAVVILPRMVDGSSWVGWCFGRLVRLVDVCSDLAVSSPSIRGLYWPWLHGRPPPPPVPSGVIQISIALQLVS